MPEHIDTDAVIAQLNRLPRTRRYYYCVARGEDGKATSASSAESVSKVLATLHWEGLD